MSSCGRFAVVTPYYKEARDVLERCIESVKRQTIGADHFIVSDGFPQDWLDGVDVKHIRLGQPHRDFGNTPRGLGALLAVSQGYDGIGLLDADNWYDSDHVEECCSVADSALETPADLVIARRRLLLPDGSPINLPEEAEHVDTSCYWFLVGSFNLLHYWVIMPAQVAPLCDRVFYRMVKTHFLTVRHAQKATVNYVSNWRFHYRIMGKTPPSGAKPIIDPTPIIDWIRNLDRRQQRLVNERCGIDMLAMVDEISGLRPPVAHNNPNPYG